MGDEEKYSEVGFQKNSEPIDGKNKIKNGVIEIMCGRVHVYCVW